MTVPKTAGELDPVSLETSLIELWNIDTNKPVENDKETSVVEKTDLIIKKDM